MQRMLEALRAENSQRTASPCSSAHYWVPLRSPNQTFGSAAYAWIRLHGDDRNFLLQALASRGNPALKDSDAAHQPSFSTGLDLAHHSNKDSKQSVALVVHLQNFQDHSCHHARWKNQKHLVHALPPLLLRLL